MLVARCLLCVVCCVLCFALCALCVLCCVLRVDGVLVRLPIDGCWSVVVVGALLCVRHVVLVVGCWLLGLSLVLFCWFVICCLLPDACCLLCVVCCVLCLLCGVRCVVFVVWCSLWYFVVWSSVVVVLLLIVCCGLLVVVCCSVVCWLVVDGVGFVWHRLIG